MIGTVVHEQSESLWASDDYGHRDPADAFSDGSWTTVPIIVAFAGASPFLMDAPAEV